MRPSVHSIRQDLTICVTSERTLDEVELFEDEKDECGLNARAFSAEQEWALRENLAKWSKVSILYLRCADIRQNVEVVKIHALTLIETLLEPFIRSMLYPDFRLQRRR